MKRASLLVLFLFQFILVSSSLAQSPAITSGLTYLSTSQNSDGSWGGATSGTDILPATAAAVETFQLLNQTATPGYLSAFSWLHSRNLGTTDYLSERIHALAVAGTDQGILLSYLDGLTGAWGGENSPDVDNLDTALALLALKKVSYSDQNVVSSALYYLTITQNLDGGWGFTQGDDSNVYMTSMVLNTLSQFKSTYNLQTPITNAVAYLLTKQNTDGGFGSSPSTVYETALAFEALLASGAVGADKAANIQNAISYITSTQLPNGSWNDDPYSTSLALRVLADVKPNLSISSSDIAFSSPAPAVGQTITVTANIHNTGSARADNVLVRFYDGDPNNGGTLIGESAIANIPQAGSGSVTMNWTVTQAGIHNIFVLVDPANTVAETNGSDNIAIAQITISAQTDLTVQGMTFVPDLPAPGQPVDVQVKVANLGGVQTSGVVVRLSVDGAVLANKTITLSGGQTAVVTFTIQAISGGIHQVAATVDPDNLIAESNETNNTLVQSLEVKERIDLVASTANIYLSDPAPKEGQVIQISTAIYNNGASPANNVLVRIYSEDPAQGGTQIGADQIIPAIPSKATGQTGWVSYDTFGKSGPHTVFVIADPLNAIPETDKTNNAAKLTFNVASRADLIVQDIQFTPATPEEGDLVQMKATVKNTGSAASTATVLKFFLGDPAAGGAQTGSDLSVYILNPGASVITPTITFNTAGKVGPNQIYALIDPLSVVDEISKTNNSLNKVLTVKDSARPDLTVTSGDISFVPSKPSMGDAVTISALITNLKDYPVSNVTVRFYDGDPAAGGAVIGTAVIPNIQGMGTGKAEILWSPVGLKGKRNIFVWADPDNAIAEANELNNMASAVLKIRLPQGAAPVNLTAYPVNSTDIGLNWQPGPDAALYGVVGYNIYRNNVLATGLKDISREGTATASSSNSPYTPDKAIDGNAATQWWTLYTVPLPQWWQEDFAVQRKIKKVAIYWISTNCAKDFQIQTWDGAQWVTRSNVAGNDSEVTVHEFAVPVMTDKVRIYITSAKATYGVYIREVDIYEERTVTPTTYQDKGLGSGVFTYYATAVDADGAESLPSNEASAPLGDITPPSPPTGLTASVSGFNVSLNWNANTEADLAGYRIYRGNLNVAHRYRGTIISGTNGDFYDMANDGTRYATGGGGALFVAYSIWTASQPGVMTITFPKVYGIDRLKVFLYDQIVNGISDNRFYRYKIESSVDGQTWQLVTDKTSGEWSGLQEEVFPQPLQVRHFRITGTFCSADQYFRVTEFEAYTSELAPDTLDTSYDMNIQVNNYSNFSEYTYDYSTGTRGPRRLLLRPFNTEEKDVLTITDKDTGLLLANYSGNLGPLLTPLLTAAYYRLYMHSDYEGTASGYSLVSVFTPGRQTARTYSETVYERGSYRYAVTAIDASGNESVLSGTVTASIADSAAPATPKNLAAKAGSGKVDVTWTANTEIDLAGYNIYRDGSATPLNGSTLITTNSYSDLSVVNLLTYTYQVTAVDLSGNESLKSAPVTASPSGVDLSISAADLSSRPRFPSVFDNISVYAKVSNIGTEPLQSPVAVTLYVGDPAHGGTAVATQAITALASGAATLVEFIWNPVGYVGTNTLYVVVDSGNVMPELNKSNNSASFTLTVLPEPEIVLKVASVDSTSFPVINTYVRVGDWAGEGIFSLTADNFTVKENGRTEQPVTATLLNSQGHKPLVDIVFVLDDTYSMHTFFDTLKLKIFDFVKGLEASNLDYMLGLVTFKDDVTVRNSGYLTGNETTFVSWIEGLAASAGGDNPENSLDALEAATTLHFRQGAQKVFVLVTDVQPHMIGDGTTYSHNTVQSIVQKLRSAGTIAFIAGPRVAPDSDPRFPTLEGTFFGAGSVTQSTGGKFYDFYSDYSAIIGDLAVSIAKMMGDYRITYTTDNPAKDGMLRNVSIDALYRYMTGTDTGQYTAPLGTKADLVAKSLALSKEAPLPGDNITLSADIRNIGGLAGQNVLVRFFDGAPATGIQIGGDQTVPSLLPSGSATLTAQWPATAGAHTLYVVVDPLNTIDESDKTNNSVSKTVTVPGSPLPDLGVGGNDITFSKTNPVKGDSVVISATIHNAGAESGNFLVLTFVGDPASGGTQIGSTTVPNLLPGSTAVVQSQWTINRAAGSFDLYVWIDPYNAIPEADKSNNKAFRTLAVGQRKIYVGVATDGLQYAANSDVGITVSLDNSDVSLWTGTGTVYVEDQAGGQVALVGTFTSGGLGTASVLGYRVPVDVVAAWNMKDTLADAKVDFGSIFQSLGVTGKTVDRNSVRVYEFDEAGNRVSEKQAKARFQSDTLASVVWLLDGTTAKDQGRRFSIYFNTADNGPSAPSANTKLPVSGKLIAFTDDRGTVSTMESREDGTFSSPVPVDDVSTAIDDNTRGVVLDDFNGDGFIDIITGSGSNSELYYYQNKADGTNTFLPKVLIGSVKPNAYQQAGYIMAIVSGDFNNDGKKDFVVSTNATGDIFLFKGNGDGTFVKSTLPPVNYGVIFGKAAADFDGDGNLDLVVQTYMSSSILLLRGNGDGTFKSPVQLTGSTYSYSLTAGDFNGDGKIDFFDFKNYDNFPGRLFKGKGDGTFLAPVATSTITSSTYTALASGDFNGDAKLDLIAATYTNRTIEFYPGKGDGTFGPKTVIATIPAPYLPLGISSSPALPEVHTTLGTPEVVASKSINFTWNTGIYPDGDYKVHAALSEGQGVVAEGSSPFTILPDTRIGSGVVIDKVSYRPNEQVTITSTITSQSVNHIFENLTASVSLASPGGQVLYTDTKPSPLLVPGQLIEIRSYWNTGTNPPGVYTVTLTVTDGTGTVLSTRSTSLTIGSDLSPSALLRGQILVDRQSLLQGEPVNITYSVTNIGNMDLPAISLSIQTVHVVQQIVYDTLPDQTGLLMGQTYSNTKSLSTSRYTAKDYLVVLRANISGVEATLAGTYFRVEGAPSAPSLNSPGNGTDVETLNPILTVNNASDPNDDKLTYEFELYSDSSLTTFVAALVGIPEGTHVTSWQVPIALQENATYYWRTRAYDGRLCGDWMLPVAFRVNIVNDPPTAPTLSSPAQNANVGTLTPILTVNNATDPDSANLTYNFDLALDANFTQIIASTVGVFEGEGSTSWQVPVTLNDNTYYYWRAQADDWLTTGPWMTTARFFVNTVNDPPTAPVIIAPANNSEVAALSADVVITNSTDPDSAVLTYAFELDTVETFDSPGIMRSGTVPQSQSTTMWRANGLVDHTFYYARAKASDGLAESSWSQVIGFFVNTANEAPSIPLLANPSNGGAVKVFNPALSVHNSSDPDRDVLTYEFELYGDAAMTNRLANATGVPETPQITTWTVPVSLMENNIYYWRARAFDGQLYSGWMPPASFMVNTANDAPSAPTLHSPSTGASLQTLTPTLSVYNAIDPDSDVLTYDFEIYSGGVVVRTITGVLQNASGITSLALAQPLPDNTTYTWRARAYDGDRYGAWMDMATFSIHIPSRNITATIDFDPNTLNKRSSGKWVVVYIELPPGYNVANINISSIRLEGTVPAEPWPYALGDYDNDGIPDLMVKFNRAAVIYLLPNGDNIPVHVTGTVGATTFEGVDWIRVIP